MSSYPVKLTVLSGNGLEFSYSHLLEQGDEVLVSFTPPDSDSYLDNLPVKVEGLCVWKGCCLCLFLFAYVLLAAGAVAYLYL